MKQIKETTVIFYLQKSVYGLIFNMAEFGETGVCYHEPLELTKEFSPIQRMRKRLCYTGQGRLREIMKRGTPLLQHNGIE